MMYQNNISFAGAGRVADSLCKELFNAGFRIDLVVSESGENAKVLAEKCNAEWSSRLAFPDSTKIVIVAVPDHRVKDVLAVLRCHTETVVAHTAGSLGLDIFPQHINCAGVFYPLQTFTKNRKVSCFELPFLIEASDYKSYTILKTLAEAIGGKVHSVDAEQRRMIHLAAVFVSNFTNHLLTCGKRVSLKAEFPFEILTPLIKETFAKALEHDPENSQTGPAVRHDANTIEKHLELLSFSPELKRIYEEMTHAIIEYYQDKDKRERC